MIVKPYERTAVQKDPRLRAGDTAERQMAHYLHREFSKDQDVFVIHGLRLEDVNQPEHDGSTGACQIDHLIVHRRGFFVIESKSVTEEVRVRPDGSGGDEWSRVYRSREMGMPSPIRQAQRQAEFLRAFLHQHGEELLGKFRFGLRTIGKLVAGSDQRTFLAAPIQLMIAVSDKGQIKRMAGWKEPNEPFRVFVAKADLVPEKIAQELERHRKGASLVNPGDAGEYGLWRMEEPEVEQVAEFLAARHVDRSVSSTGRRNRTAPNRKSPGNTAVRVGESVKATCRNCDSSDLTARSGRYGYYWRCGKCEENTPMAAECSACGAKRKQNGGVRVRKEKSRYFRECEACGASETIWVEG